MNRAERDKLDNQARTVAEIVSNVSRLLQGYLAPPNQLVYTSITYIIPAMNEVSTRCNDSKHYCFSIRDLVMEFPTAATYVTTNFSGYIKI